MELVLLVCLIASPAECREERISSSLDPVAQRVCMATAPPLIAEWQQSHPKWRVARWRCVDVKARSQPI